MRVDAAILAGGRARRMAGANKALLEVGGKTILARQLEALGPVVGEVLLVAPDLAPYAAVSGIRAVRDLQPDRGPLAGLEAAFDGSSAGALIVVGCDLPFLQRPLLERLRDASPGADAVVPRIGGRPQALHARYGRSTVPAIAARLAAGRLRLLDLLADLSVAWLEEAELRALDPQLRGFTNINTPAELAAARLSSSP